MNMKPATFEQYRRLIHRHVGIALGADKQALLSSRIRVRMLELRLPSPEAYLQKIEADTSGRELVLLLDSITTNHTFFFREAGHLSTMTALLKPRIENGQKRLRIWSAACSSGEEPYTLGMTLISLIEDCRAVNIDCKILATDISTKVLAKAHAGVYSADRLSFVPQVLRDRFFRKVSGGGGKQYQVTDELRRMITFRRLNLTAERFPLQGPFDAIFCRNVMIYFDEATRAQLVGQLSRLLSPDSLLFVGMTETVMGLVPELKYFEPAVYCKSLAGKSSLASPSNRTSPATSRTPVLTGGAS